VQPENYRAHYYLGRLLRDSREYVGALLAFEKAQRDPDLKVKALVERGAAFLSMNNVEKAVIDLERAVRLGGSDGSAEVLFGRYLLAEAYERTRVLDKAITQWEQIYQKKPGYRDVAAKLSQYQDLRTDDRMKDYLTANPADFQEICRAVVTSMGLAVRDVSDVQNGCQVIAVDDESKWRNARKLPTVIRFLRVPEVVQDTTARSVYEQARKMNVNRAIIVTSSGFSRKAAEFAETRPIDLLGKERLQELLRKAEFSWSS
jgi:tetratricopeptide (TPR) repeat protein